MKAILSAGVIILIAAGAYYLFFRPIPVSAPTPITTSTMATFYCANDATIDAAFTVDAVALTLSDGRAFSLPQTISGSGARYEASTTESDVVFWNKGDDAFLTENGKTTYGECTAAHVEASGAPGYATYTNQSRTFAFAFPTNFKVVGSPAEYIQGVMAGATRSGMILATILVPSEYQKGTNFSDAKFSVSTSADPADVATCLLNPFEDQGGSNVVNMGDVQYTKLTYSDAAAGNRYDVTSYRTVRSGLCYAVEYTIHYGNIQNYPKGSVKEFDEAKVKAALDEVAQSFRFL